MAQVLDLSKSVYEICTKYPVIKGLMAENGFAEITEPGRLQTMGRFMTIPKGCDHKGVDLEEQFFFALVVNKDLVKGVHISF